MTRKRILLSIMTLALLGWTWNLFSVRSQFAADTAAVRFSNQKGECQVEVINSGPFILTVFDGKQEFTHQSRIDPLTFCHSVEISLPSEFVDGRSTGWSEKMLGIEYQAMSAADPIRYRVTSKTKTEKRTSGS